MYFCKIPTKMNVREVVSKVLLTRPKTHFRISATCFVCPVFPSCLSAPCERNVIAIPLTCNVGEKFFSVCLVWKTDCVEVWITILTVWHGWGGGSWEHVIPTAGIVQYLNDPLSKSTFNSLFLTDCIMLSDATNVSFWCCRRRTLHHLLYVWQNVLTFKSHFAM